jgi:hypothetical protein
LVQIFSSTPSVNIPPLMSKPKFHSHTKQQAKFMLFYILIFKFLGNRREDKRFWTEW